MSIQRNQSVIDYNSLPLELDAALDMFMAATEVNRDSFRRMAQFYTYVVLNYGEYERTTLNLFVTVEKIDIDNAWIQFW